MIRSGSSLRTQSRIAVDAVTGWSSPISPAAGSTAATGSAEKRMMMKPITALQNPATIQGKVIANRTSAARSRIPNPPGVNASAASHSDPAMVTKNRTAKVARLANMLFSATSACVMAGGCARSRRGYGFSFARGRCRLPLITRQAARNSSPRSKKMAVSASADTASALWYRGPGQVEIRQEVMLRPAQAKYA